MIRRWLRRLLGQGGDVYVVRDGIHIVGVSARFQGAVRMRAAHIQGLTDRMTTDEGRANVRHQAERLTKIENHELQDAE